MKRIISFMIASAMLFSIAGCGKKKEASGENMNAANVSVYRATSEQIEDTVTYTGEIKAFESVGIAAKVSAKVTEVMVQEGDRVTAGQVLAKLDEEDIRLSYNQVQASYNSAVANYNMVVNSSTVQASTGAKQKLESAQIAYDAAKSAYDREVQLNAQNSNVKLAEQAYQDASAAYERAKNLYDQDTSLVAAKNALTSAQDALNRTEKLFEMGAATQLELDQAKQNAQNAQANVDNLEVSKQASLDAAHMQMLQAQENLKTAQVNVNAALDHAKNTLDNAAFALDSAKEAVTLTEVSNAETIKNAKAGVDAARANLALAENNLKNTSIIAPIDGFVASNSANVGQMAVAGYDLFQIKNSSDINCEINVTESVITSVTAGTPAMISVKSAGVENVSGTVTLVNTVKNDATGMYKVQVTIPNADNQLKVGMFVDVELVTGQAEGAVVIPSEAIIWEQEEAYVFVAEGETAMRVPVVTGIENDEMTEIISGVSAGDEVVVKGKEYLSEKNNQIKIVSTEER